MRRVCVNELPLELRIEAAADGSGFVVRATWLRNALDELSDSERSNAEVGRKKAARLFAEDIGVLVEGVVP